MFEALHHRLRRAIYGRDRVSCCVATVFPAFITLYDLEITLYHIRGCQGQKNPRIGLPSAGDGGPSAVAYLPHRSRWVSIHLPGSDVPSGHVIASEARQSPQLEQIASSWLQNLNNR